MSPLRGRTISRQRASVLPMVKPYLRQALEELRRNTPRANNSANVASDSTFVGFFQYYMRCPFYLMMDYEADFCLRIKPKSWALGILKSYQKDMQGIVIVLSEAIFSAEDAFFRDLDFLASTIFNDEQHRQFYERKKRIITRAALWLWNNVGSEVNLFGPIPINENEPLNIPPELQHEIDSGFSNYSPVSDEENDLPLMCIGLSDIEKRSRIYKHPLKNNVLLQQLTLNWEIIQRSARGDLTLEMTFGTLMGFLITRQVVALGQLSSCEFKDTVEILEFLTRATFAEDAQYSDTFFGPVQVGNDEFQVLENRRSRGVSELTRSLFRMVYRRYSDGSDPQHPQSSFVSLKVDSSAAVLLVSVMGAAKSISMLPSTVPLKEWNTGNNSNHDIVLTFPSRGEYAEIVQNLRNAWGVARFSEVNEPNIGDVANPQQYGVDNPVAPLVVIPVHFVDEAKILCVMDDRGNKCLIFQDPDKQRVRFNISTLQETRMIMKNTPTGCSGSQTNGSPTNPENSRKTSPEYQGGRHLLRNTFDRETVLEMNKSTKDSPEGIAVTRMLMCLKYDLENSVSATESLFLTQAQHLQPNDSMSVPYRNNLHGEVNTWLFCEFVSQLRRMENAQ